MRILRSVAGGVIPAVLSFVVLCPVIVGCGGPADEPEVDAATTRSGSAGSPAGSPAEQASPERAPADRPRAGAAAPGEPSPGTELTGQTDLEPARPAADHEPAWSGRPASNAAMAERLLTIARGTKPQRYPYANGVRARLMHQAALNAPLSPDRFALLFRGGLEYLRAGETEEALARFDEADRCLEELRRAGIPVDPNSPSAVMEGRALAMLRLGEQENCLENHTIDSCLMPIGGDGVHQLQRGSRGAIEGYTALLELAPESPTYRWLLNLAYMTVGEYPDRVPARYLIAPDAFESDHDLARFPDRAGDAGLGAFTLAGGTVMEDLTGDGLLDLVSTSWGLLDQMRFYVRRPDGSFEDRTEAAGLTGIVSGLNLCHADYDNDGDRDLLVLRGGWLFADGRHPNSLLRNDGHGRFTDVSIEAGLDAARPSQTAAWGDLNHDGWLDLVIGNEMASEAEQFPVEIHLNDGDGTFTERAADAGVDVRGMVKAVVLGDYDGDGRLDLYCSRYGQPNVLLRNEGAGPDGVPRFTDVTAAAGVAEPVESFPAWWFDYDNDGHLDLFVASFTGFNGNRLDACVRSFLGDHSGGAYSRLYRNRGDGTFEDMSIDAGLQRVLPVMGANFGDLDTDGWLDFYLGTGQPRLSVLLPNVMFRNDGAGRFQDVTTAGGFGNIQKGHGVSFGDLDHDGDEDIWVSMGGAFSGDLYPNLLFENPGHGHRWLTIRTEGLFSNRDGIGTRIRVLVETPTGTRTIHRVVGTGGSFGSSTLAAEIGLGDATGIVEVEVVWPRSGRRMIDRDVELDTVQLAREDAEALERIDVRPLPIGGGGGGHDHGHHHHHGGGG